MKCKECYKELNEMTVYCDRCGAQLTKDKPQLNFATIEKGVLPINIETSYTRNLQEEVRNAYFLSNIKSDFKGFSRRYIDQYILYIQYRTYYEKNKRLLTTNEFSNDKALAILSTLSNRKPNPKMLEILKEEYGDDFENKVIPKSITDQVEKVYLSNYDIKKMNSSRFMLKSLTSIFISTVKSFVLFGLVGAILYLVLPMVIADFDLIDFVVSNQYILYSLGGLVLIRGIWVSRKNRLYYPFEDIINSNTELKKHIKNNVKKRIKTLEYRQKKNKK